MAGFKNYDKLLKIITKKSTKLVQKVLYAFGHPLYLLIVKVDDFSLTFAQKFLSFLLLFSTFLGKLQRKAKFVFDRYSTKDFIERLLFFQKVLAKKLLFSYIKSRKLSAEKYKLLKNLVLQKLGKLQAFLKQTKLTIARYKSLKVALFAQKSKDINRLFNKSKSAFNRTRKVIAKYEISAKLRIYLQKFRLIFIKSRKRKEKNTFPKRVISRSLRILYFLSFLFGFLFFLSIISISSVWFFVLNDVPSVETLLSRKVDVSTKIYDRNGILLYKIYKDQNRTPIKLSEIPLHVQLATLAIEDAEFYSHPGFSIKGIVRAVKKNVEEGELSGGSTITQQLVKNTLLSPEKTLERKIKEVYLALQVERQFSKKEILEMYLNEVSYGGTAYGIQEAARTYFDKDVQDITIAEAALLAGLPKSPTQFSPFGQNPKLAKERQRSVLNLMKANGFLDESLYQKASNEDLRFAKNQIDIRAPHFVMYVRKNLEEKYGQEVVEKGGLSVKTTLDMRIQNLVEKVVKEEIGALQALNVGNAAVVVMSPKNGEILAMVGSKDYFDTQADGNVNVALSARQPGSSIKIINYAYALSNTHTPASIIDDSPITFQIKGSKPYTPKNYDGKYRGKITLRNALAESRNIPAVKVLSSYGVEGMIDLGKQMGITTWEDKNRFGLSLTLGGGEVRLIDLARVYATVANYGIRPSVNSILKVSNFNSKILEENDCDVYQEVERLKIASRENVFNIVKNTKAAASDSAAFEIQTPKTTCEKKQVLSPQVAYLLTDILKDNSARTPAFGSNSMLVIPGHPEVAVKTGTSNDLRDNLTLGYSQDYLIAVWVGNNDNSPMSRVASGVTGASPIFNKIMSSLLAEKESLPWDVPKGLVQLPICTLTGTLACSGCPVRQEWFLQENKPEKACSPEWFQKQASKTIDQ